MEPETKDYLAKMYETLRYQQGLICHLTKTTTALQILVSSIPGYQTKFPDALQEAANSVDVQGQNALIATIDLEIRRLRGGDVPIAEA
ncbi:MAG: hypothetical protein WCC87_18350 [Candidatus Korobacteraceae bacterium]|jgi:hypothetical protein